MADTPEIAVLAEGDRVRLGELLRVLQRGGFDARIVAPPDAEANT